MDEVGFRIPGTGFRILKPWIPDSKGKKMLDSGFPYMGRIIRIKMRYFKGENKWESSRRLDPNGPDIGVN